MTVGDVLSYIDQLAPFSTQEEWDNSGLLVGAPSEPAERILFALDITQSVIREACIRKASLIVTHHPIMFSPRRRITDEDMEGKLIRQLIKNGISLISAHTNLDRASGGINDILAARCGLSSVTGEGFFRYGVIPEPMRSGSYEDVLSDNLSCTVRRMGPENKIVSRIGVSSGSGGDFWQEAVSLGCDAMVTGEMKHHLALAAADAGLVVFECGHYATEVPGIHALAETLQKSLDRIKCNVRVFVSESPAYAFSQQP